MTDRSEIAQSLLALCRHEGIDLTVDKGSLVIDAPEEVLIPCVVAGLRQYKVELLDLLGKGLRQYEPSLVTDSLDWDEPIECAECGGIDAWWNVLGDMRCAVCEPPTDSRRWLEKAERLRRRHQRQHQSTNVNQQNLENSNHED